MRRDQDGQVDDAVLQRADELLSIHDKDRIHSAIDKAQQRRQAGCAARKALLIQRRQATRMEAR